MKIRSTVAVAVVSLAAWAVPARATPPSQVYYDRSPRHTDPWADRAEHARPAPAAGRAPTETEVADDERETIEQLAKQVKELTRQVKELNAKLEKEDADEPPRHAKPDGIKERSKQTPDDDGPPPTRPGPGSHGMMPMGGRMGMARMGSMGHGRMNGPMGGPMGGRAMRGMMPSGPRTEDDAPKSDRKQVIAGRGGSETAELADDLNLPEGMKLQPGDKVIVIIRGKTAGESSDGPKTKSKVLVREKSEKDEEEKPTARVHGKRRVEKEADDDSDEKPVSHTRNKPQKENAED